MPNIIKSHTTKTLASNILESSDDHIFINDESAVVNFHSKKSILSIIINIFQIHDDTIWHI